ncbi:MAG: hypothetical protein HY271_01240 [Deltaproteobacteria bacterium]|nr:hypothetical protein [Deltaproteobacteria bacterium]
MVTESVVERRGAAAGTIASGALVADLAADSADLLDIAAALGLEFRHVVAELLRAPEQPAPSVVRALASIGPRPRSAPPQGDAPPFVWVRLVSAGHLPKLSVRAGWLVPAAVQLIVDEARAAGPETEIQIIVPLDSGEAAAARVRALCAGLAPEIRLTIDVQGETRSSRLPSARRTGWWGPSGRGSHDPRPGGHGFRTGTWVVFGPVGAAS